MQSLAVEQTSGAGVHLLSVEGEIDIASTPRLIPALNQAVQEAPDALVIDLTSCGFMDSTGLALLINAQRRLSRRDKGFAVVCPAGPLLRVFEITDLRGKLRVRPDRESAAQAALRSRAA